MPFVQKKFFCAKKTKIIEFLCQTLNCSELEAKRLVDKSRVFQNNQQVTKKGELIEGEILITLFENEKAKNLPIFTHNEFAIYDKPSGILVHPQKISSEYTLLDDIKSTFGKTANITHRIDKETSGLVLVSKNKESEKFFKLAFEAKKIEKSYFAYAKGKIDKRYEINESILKFRDLSSRLDPLSEDGRKSLTIIEPIRYFENLNITLVKAIPITGRTHQIRIHLWSIGYPIIGEPLYGNTTEFRNDYIEKKLTEKERIKITGANRLLLHANELKFKFDSSYHIFSKSDFTTEEFLKVVGLVGLEPTTIPL